MARLIRFGGIHDEYSLEMYKKLIQNRPDTLIEEPKKKDSKKKTKEKTKKKRKKSITKTTSKISKIKKN